MSIIEKVDKGIFKVYNKYRKHKLMFNIIAALGYICILIYYAMFIPFVVSSKWVMENEAIWLYMYSKMSPFTTGAYILGMVVLFQHIMYDSIIIKSLISLFYGMIVVFSLIAIMGMREIWELSMYVAHILIIFLCILVSYRKRKNKID